MERMMKKSSYELLGQDPQWVKKLLFAGVFIQENKLHAIFDRYNEMTSKQWLLMATMTSFTDAPDLSMLAKVMGCSRQNVKKLILEKSPKDARSLCVVMSKQGLRFRKDMEELTDEVHQALFSEFSNEEITQYYQLSIKLMHGIDHLEVFFKNRQKGAEG